LEFSWEHFLSDQMSGIHTITVIEHNTIFYFNYLLEMPPSPYPRPASGAHTGCPQKSILLV